MSAKKRKADKEPVVGKTEEMLKQEAKERARQQAKIEALKPPPSPQKKKAENYWYHYKWATIGGIFALVLAAFFIKDIVFRTNPDATIILATQTPISQEALDSFQAELEKHATDFNGDGKISISIDNIYMPASALRGTEEPEVSEESTEEDILSSVQMGGEQDYASVMKLTTVIAASSDPLYLVDDALYLHLSLMAASGTDDDGNPIEVDLDQLDEDSMIFQQLEAVSSADKDRLAFSDTALSGAEGCEVLEDMTFCLRFAGNKEKSIAYNQYCLDLLQSISK